VCSGLNRFDMQWDIQSCKVLLQHFQGPQNEIYSNGGCLVVSPVLVISVGLSIDPRAYLRAHNVKCDERLSALLRSLTSGTQCSIVFES
jgi:hypothetical protein